MRLPRETTRRLLDLLHVGNRFKLMFGQPLNPTDPDVILFQKALEELKPHEPRPSATTQTQPLPDIAP
jgi:hypothetical protein